MKRSKIFLFLILTFSCNSEHKDCFELKKINIKICIKGHFLKANQDKKFGVEYDIDDIYLVDDVEDETIFLVLQKQNKYNPINFDDESFRYWIKHKEMQYSKIYNLDSVTIEDKLFISFFENKNYHLNISSYMNKFNIEFEYIKRILILVKLRYLGKEENIFLIV